MCCTVQCSAGLHRRLLDSETVQPAGLTEAVEDLVTNHWTRLVSAGLVKSHQSEQGGSGPGESVVGRVVEAALAGEPPQFIEGGLWRVDRVRGAALVRGNIVVEAASRRLGGDAGKVVSSLLALVRDHPGSEAAVSSQLGWGEVEARVKQDWGQDSLASQQLDQYLKLLVL